MKWTWDKFGYPFDDVGARDSSPETQLLGCILLSPSVCVEIDGIDDFQDHRNRQLFHHLSRMFVARGTVDVTDLVALLKKSGDYERIGVYAYLAQIVNSVPHAAHATYYARQVHENASE